MNNNNLILCIKTGVRYSIKQSKNTEKNNRNCVLILVAGLEAEQPWLIIHWNTPKLNVTIFSQE